MNLESYQDYKAFKPKIVQGLDRDQCALFNAVVMKYLLKKYSSTWQQDLSSNEQQALKQLADYVWGSSYSKISERGDLPAAYDEFSKIGLDDDGDPLGLSPETVDVLASLEYSASEKYGPFQETILYMLELLSDGVDRELDEKYPEYIQASQAKMFAYKEMRNLISTMELVVDSVRQCNSPEYALSIFQKTV